MIQKKKDNLKKRRERDEKVTMIMTKLENDMSKERNNLEERFLKH